MTTSDTGMLGVRSVEQRKGALAAEFYPEHTMLPNTWYFLGHAVGHKNLEAHVAAAKGRAGDAVRTELGEKYRGRDSSKHITDGLDTMARVYDLLERTPLSVPFLGTETLEVNLQLQSGGMIDLLRQDEGLARDKARVRAHSIPYDSIGVGMNNFIQGLHQSQEPDSRDVLDMSLRDQARAAIPFFASPQFDIDAWGSEGMDHFLVGFRMYGPLSMTKYGDKLALVVTSPFSNGKIYVTPPARVEQDGISVLQYSNFIEQHYNDPIGIYTAITAMKSSTRQYGKLLPLETTSDPNALGSLEISVAMIPDELISGINHSAALVNASRSIAYQEPNGHIPSPIIDPFKRMEVLDTIYGKLKPEMDRMREIMHQAAQNMPQK